MIRIHLDDTTRDELQACGDRTSRPRSATASRWSSSPTPAGPPPASPPTSATLSHRPRRPQRLPRPGPRRPRPPPRGPAPDAPAATTSPSRSATCSARSGPGPAQLAEALRPPRHRPQPAPGPPLPRGCGRGYRRTASTLKHKQDPAKAARAEAVLGNLLERAEAGLAGAVLPRRVRLRAVAADGLQLVPAGAAEAGQVRVPAGPAGQRPGGLPARSATGPAAGGHGVRADVNSDDLLAFLGACRAAAVPRVVVLDNASLHISKVVKAQRKELARRGIYLYYLPPYSPELNRIEPVFRQVKHHEIPVGATRRRPSCGPRSSVASSPTAESSTRKVYIELRPAA